MRLVEKIGYVFVSMWLGFLFGQLHHAEKVAPRIGMLEHDLRQARLMASRCHRVMAEHWAGVHLAMPGSPEVIISGHQLADDLELSTAR